MTDQGQIFKLSVLSVMTNLILLHMNLFSLAH